LRRERDHDGERSHRTQRGWPRYRGRRGDLAKILWHDGLGLSLYAKRLDRGKFIWPSTKEGVVSISAAQMAYMLEGIDWRNPQLTWRPKSAG
jgi:transposase